MGNKTRKEFIFKEGAAALRALGVSGDYYACPICLMLCNREQLKAGNLTEEHVPARSQGGKVIILTCRTCNNQAGHNYEYALKDRDKLQRQLDGLEAADAAVGRVKLKLGETVINATLNKLSGNFDFTVPESINNPKIMANFKSWMSQKKSQQIDIILDSRYDRGKVRLSDLKSAFLACVANFGYSYASSSYISFIRRQLIRAEETDYIARYENVSRLPPYSIFADLGKEITLVKMRHEAVMLPLSTLPTDKFLSIASTTARLDLQGGYQPFPKSFIAQLDHQGNHKITIIEQPSL